MTIFPSGAAPARAGRSSSAANTSATRHAVMIVVLPRGAARSIEGRHGFAGAPRALGGLGGHFGAPHQVVYAENSTVCARALWSVLRLTLAGLPRSNATTRAGRA